MPVRSSASCLSAARFASRCHASVWSTTEYEYAAAAADMVSTGAAPTTIIAPAGTPATATNDEPPTTRIESTADDITPANTSEIHVQYGATERISMPMTSGPKSS